jgi:hypothetical protein
MSTVNDHSLIARLLTEYGEQAVGGLRRCSAAVSLLLVHDFALRSEWHIERAQRRRLSLMSQSTLEYSELT